jgi:dTDP-4-amino-4,6-dideoxygalactose transaminase
MGRDRGASLTCFARPGMIRRNALRLAMSLAPILLNDFQRQWTATATDVMSAVGSVGESGWYILGKQVEAFERDLGTWVQRRHAIGCANGLDAIEIALRALGLQPGQKVLTTPLSAFATTLAVLRAGGVPVFVDVDATGLLDLDLAERELKRDPSLKFLLPVHLFGQAQDLDRLQAIAASGVHVIEDMAQAIGARSGKRQVGSVGRISATSFYPTKNLGALGDGGAMFTDDDALAGTCRALRDYGQTAKYVHDQQGLNSRLDELHAAILGKAFLPRLEGWTARRAQVAAKYLAGMRNAAVTPLPAPRGSTSVWHLFPVQVAASKRAAFAQHLKQAGVHTAVHYPRIIPDQGALRGVPFEVRGELPRARALADGELSLPIHPFLTDVEVQRVIDAVNAWAAA